MKPALKGAAFINEDAELTPHEQLDAAWTRYVAALSASGLHVTNRQARQLAVLADHVAELHEREALSFRDRAKFWRRFAAPRRRR
jgi:hypothetical protein